MKDDKASVDDCAPGPFAPGLPGEEPTHTERLAPEYWRAFSVVAFTMNRFIMDHLIRATRFFGNDSEAMILFGTVAHFNVAHLVTPGTSPSQDLGVDGIVPDPQPRLRPVRIRDLAQITGRPRETIRRKLEQLEAQGRVGRHADGYVINLDAIEPEMEALTVDAVRRFMQTSRVIDAALRDAGQALTRERGEPAA